ncbi:unnamed protein product [Rotaria magnacalcarata]|uniref:Uncharacterized protein n=2 Tax=Rotaria magnacalcarata TaxID=392030 RepID=A0A816RLU0_9BILA|nr:unnamed protein product [Rotaria magnacalcarata]
MLIASKSMLRPAPLLYRACYSNVLRQTLAPLTTSSQHLAELTNVDPSKSLPSEEVKPVEKSFDSVPVHLGRIAKVVMVLGGLYGRYRDVPDSMPNRVYQKTKDKFRARCVVFSLFGTGLLAYIAATRGKSAQKEGKRYTDSVYEMHRGSSRLHEQLESKHNSSGHRERYSPLQDGINK